MKKTFEALSVILGVLLVFLVQNSEISKYESVLLGILIIFAAIYFSLKNRSQSQKKLFTGNPIELFLIVSIVVYIVALTNGLISPIFFLLYFVLFLIAFMASSITIWVFLISLMLFFIPQASNNINLDTFIKLGSLLLITPIAYFVGSEFERRGILNQHISSKSNEIIEDAKNLKETADDPDEIETLNDIIDEATTLKKETNN